MPESDLQMSESREATRPDEGPQRTAAGRVLALLDAFGHSDGALTLSELSRFAGLSLTTTHRLVHEVLDWGGLEVDSRGRYRLSTKFLHLASSSASGLRLRETALPHLMRLHQQVGGSTVHLAVRDGEKILYLDALRSIPNYTGESRIGGGLPLHVTAAGIVLLAHETDDFVEDYLSRPLQRFTQNTIVDRAELLASLATARAQRYYVYPKSVSTEAGGIAAPVTDERAAVRAVVSAVWFLDQQDPKSMTTMVRETAAQISRALAAPRAPLHARTIDFNRRRAGLV